MPCYSCIEKLANKLMRHHKIDMIRAFELAEKAVERVESRNEPQQQPQILSGNPTDYIDNCAGACTPFPCYNYGGYCDDTYDCRVGAGNCIGMGACGCPAPPIPNSHQTANHCTCIHAAGCSQCMANVCTVASIPCVCLGTCSYDCDPGYVWNPVTLQCDLVPVVGEARWDGYYFLDTG